MEPCPQPSWSQRLSSSGSYLSVRQWKRHPLTSDNLSLVLFFWLFESDSGILFYFILSKHIHVLICSQS